MGIVQLHSLDELNHYRISLSGDLGFVPTMGALHEGHASLVKRSTAENQKTIATIFVNPLQFGKNEDFDAYPKTYESDVALLESLGVDAVFHPDANEFYSASHSVFISESSLSKVLCGAYRPGHFDGVMTVLTKFFNLIRPKRAYFGQKDFQQCAVVERMVRDLNFNIEIIRCDTLREKDGLALSSRNRYLNQTERAVAPRLYQTLLETVDLFKKGETRIEVLEEVGKKSLETDFNVQYFEIRNAISLDRPKEANKNCVLAAAAFLGKTRLIDNILF